MIIPNPIKRDLLASVLLSVPLAMGIYSFNSDDEALIPYQRLIELGSDSAGSVGSYTNTNKELEEFLNQGNLDEAIDTLTKWKNNYFALRRDSLVKEGNYNRYPSVGWEIGVRVADVLSDIIESLESLKTQDQDDF